MYLKTRPNLTHDRLNDVSSSLLLFPAKAVLTCFFLFLEGDETLWAADIKKKLEQLRLWNKQIPPYLVHYVSLSYGLQGTSFRTPTQKKKKEPLGTCEDYGDPTVITRVKKK